MTSLQQWTVELVGPKGYVHGWVKVGLDVEHKDSSKGVVRHYDPATQTAHVEWASGPRSKSGGVQTVEGRMGTTKAYHLKQGRGLGPGGSGGNVKVRDQLDRNSTEQKPIPTDLDERGIPPAIDRFIKEAATHGVRVERQLRTNGVPGKSGYWAVIVPRRGQNGVFDTRLDTGVGYYTDSNGKRHIRGIGEVKNHPLYQQSAKRGTPLHPIKPQPTVPTLLTGRKHDWVKPGIQIQHKDGSIGTVRSYDSNTQTIHADWTSGKRANTSGTTKAYHTSRLTGTRLSGREKALYGTKYPGSGETKKPPVEIKRPADPFATIPNAYGACPR